MKSVRYAMQCRRKVIGATSGPASVAMSRAGLEGAAKKAVDRMK
jgi:hypothetical protein